MRIHALKKATARAFDSTVTVLDPVTHEARECFRQQASAIEALAGRLDGAFSEAVRALYGVEGHVVITGIGKSGLIGKKLAATLASTGTPSFFLHSAEAFHGDLGMITDHDAVVLISYSGETEEVIRLLPHLQARGVRTVAIVGNVDSTLGLGVDVALDVSVDREICPNNLAPTSSTMATLAMGDALAVSLIRMRGFHPEDFARLHPGGSLGKKLLSRVRDVMVDAKIPAVSPTATAKDCVLALAKSRLHVLLVMDDGDLHGVVTEKELRRVLELSEASLGWPVTDVMNSDPLLVDVDARAAEAEERLRIADAEALVAVDDDGRVCGLMVPPHDR